MTGHAGKFPGDWGNRPEGKVSLSFRGYFGGLSVDDAQAVADAFHAENSFGKARRLPARERTLSGTFERHLALVDMSGSDQKAIRVI